MSHFQSTWRVSSDLYASLPCHRATQPEHLKSPIMEKNLILPTQSLYQETDGFEAEEPEPYLEAKLYIERMEQESKKCQEEICKDRTHKTQSEPSDHGVSLTVYPIRVPSMHLTCATVQWDMPHTTAGPSPSGSMDEMNCTDGACLDWVDDPDMPSMSQEVNYLIPEMEQSQTDTVLLREPAVTAENKDRDNSTQDLNENVCMASLNEEDQASFKEASQTSVTSADNEPETSETKFDQTENTSLTGTFEKDFDQTENTSLTGTFEKDFDQTENSTEDSGIQFCVESSDALEEKNKETRVTSSETQTQPKQVLGDAGKRNTRTELYSEDGNQTGSSSEEDIDSTHHSRTADQNLELDKPEQTQEPDPKENSDQTHPSSAADSAERAEHPDVACVGRQPIEAVDSEKVEAKLQPEISQSEQLGTTGNSEKSQPVIFVATLDMAGDDMVELEQLQQAETFEKLQEAMQAVGQEEEKCAGLVKGSVELEPPEATPQLERPIRLDPSEQVSQHNCSDDVECHEQAEHQDILHNEKLIEDFAQTQCPFETEPTGQSNESEILSEIKSTEMSKQSECSAEFEPLEHLNKTDVSGEKDPFKQSKEYSNERELSQNSDPEKTEQTQSNQPPQQQHSEFKQQQNKEENQIHQSGETDESLSDHNHGTEEELQRQVLQRVESVEPVVLYENGTTDVIDREQACRLAERLYRLENVQRTDVVQHLDKDNDFSRAVGEEYLKFFDFTDQNLDEALRSFLKEVVLIGETQERERVLDRFSCRYHQCNPDTFSSSGAVLTLTCAMMLLNTDLHGQNVGKSMSMTDFTSNMNGMNEGENFSKDLLKMLYNSIKSHQLEWAVEEKYLMKSMNSDQDSDPDVSLRSKSNPFQDIAHDKKASVFQKGFLKRKAHADIDGKRTPWGKRSWKTFYAVLKGMVLYLQKDEYRKDWQSSEEVLSIHHSLAERAQDYTKRPHVFRLQTADWRVFLFEAASTEQMNSWIGRINLVSALHSSPPFPAAVGSRRKFCRPILPATRSALTLEKQLQSHAASLQSFQEDLSALQQGAPEGRKPKAREAEEHRHREEYLQHERCRYEAYVRLLEIWQTIIKSSERDSGDPKKGKGSDLTLFDQELWKGMAMEEETDDEIDGGLKRSHSSPSLELEVAPPLIAKVRRNISERRTYRKIVIPRRNKEL